MLFHAVKKRHRADDLCHSTVHHCVSIIEKEATQTHEIAHVSASESAHALLCFYDLSGLTLWCNEI